MQRGAPGTIALDGSPRGVLDVGRIERDLAAVWKSACARAGGTAVYRACSMTLVALVSGRDGAHADPWFLEVADRRPCRLLRVELTAGDGDRLEASARARCHLRRGAERLICVEEIRILAPEAVADRLPSAVRSLAVGGLPLVLFAPGPAARRGPAFRALAGDADLALAESQDPGDLLLEDGARDLAWNRIEGLRGALARAGDEPDWPRALASSSSVRIEHGGGPVPAAALLLAGWIGTALGLGPPRPGPGGALLLGRPGHQDPLHLGFDAAPGRPPEPHQVALSGACGPVSVELGPSGRWARASGPAEDHLMALPRRDRAGWVLEELGRRRPDAWFAAALAAAREMVPFIQERR